MSDRPATDAEVAHYRQFVGRPLEPDERFDLLATDFASLLARIEAQDTRLGEMEKALKEDVAECAAWCDVDKGCLACYRIDTCKKRAALEGRD